jgi:hypothetical protein
VPAAPFSSRAAAPGVSAERATVWIPKRVVTGAQETVTIHQDSRETVTFHGHSMRCMRIASRSASTSAVIDLRLCVGGDRRRAIHAAAFVDPPESEVIAMLGQVPDAVDVRPCGPERSASASRPCSIAAHARVLARSAPIRLQSTQGLRGGQQDPTHVAVDHLQRGGTEAVVDVGDGVGCHHHLEVTYVRV